MCATPKQAQSKKKSENGYANYGPVKNSHTKLN